MSTDANEQKTEHSTTPLKEKDFYLPKTNIARITKKSIPDTAKVCIVINN